MQTSGTSEGLRGLIDSSLIKSIKEIIEHRASFGPSVLHIGKSRGLLLSLTTHKVSSHSRNGDFCSQRTHFPRCIAGGATSGSFL
jgi:Domain of Unknown Function (DUF913)